LNKIKKLSDFYNAIVYYELNSDDDCNWNNIKKLLKKKQVKIIGFKIFKIRQNFLIIILIGEPIIVLFVKLKNYIKNLLLKNLKINRIIFVMESKLV